MLNRVLIWLNDEIDLKAAVESGKNLQKKYDCDVEYLYIKDYLRNSADSIYPLFGVDYLVSDKIREHEEKHVKELDLLIELETGKKVRAIEGDTLEILLKEMLAFDLLILGRKNYLSQMNKEILHSHYKPVIFIGKKPIKMKDILFANDGSFRSNKSLFSFINIFNDSKSIKSVSVNRSNSSLFLSEYLKKSNTCMEIVEEDGGVFEVLERESRDSGMVICGNLGHSYMYEKITSNEGLKLITQLEAPVFIM